MYYPKSIRINNRYRGPIESDKLNLFYKYLLDDINTLKEAYNDLEEQSNEIDNIVKNNLYDQNKESINNIRDFIKECEC